MRPKPTPAATSKKKRVKSPRKSKPSAKKNLRFYKLVLLLLIATILAFIGIYYLLEPKQEYGVRLPEGYEVHGFDISHHQGSIDWDQLVKTQNNATPLRFIFMKATEGGDHLDTQFEDNFESAKKYGFMRGAYHFYNPATPPDRQAEFFIKNVALSHGDLPPVLDIEKRGSKPLATFQKEIAAWIKKIETHYGTKPIIYTYYSFKNSYLNTPLFDSYPFWIAHYYVEEVEYENEWHFWQHTDMASLPGIGRRVDLNIFNGTEDDLQRMMIKNTID